MPNSTRLACPSPARLTRAIIAALSGSRAGASTTGTLNGLVGAKGRSAATAGGAVAVAGSAGGGEVIVTGAPTDAEAGVGTGGDAGVSSFSDGDVSTGAVPGVVEHATVVNATIATA